MLKFTSLVHRTDGSGHWLKFNPFKQIIGCHCGFVASQDDNGFGDSVLEHFEEVVRREVTKEISEGRWEPEE